MGHVRLGTLPQTQSWQEVVSLVRHGAAARQVAQAAVAAAECGLRRAAKDAGVVESVCLLVNLPRAAKAREYREALHDLGLLVPSEPTLLALVAAFSATIDRAMPNNRGRTDLGEMAQMAGAETLAGLLADRTASLFDSGPQEVRRELAGLAQQGPFGLLARRYFGRLTYKALDYFLSRVLTLHVGENCPFLTLQRVADFNAALEQHCSELAVVVERFCPEWVSKTFYEAGRVGRDEAAGLVHGAFNKMVDTLKAGAADAA